MSSTMTEKWWTYDPCTRAWTESIQEVPVELNLEPGGVNTIEDPLDRQVGGSHYKDMKIQPIEYILANDLGFCEGNIVKYITRYSQKGGVQDIDKVIHYAEILKAQLEKT